MSPVDAESVSFKLLKLKEATRIVQELLDEEGEKIIKNERLKGALYFNLVICIEIILDIGNHILAAKFNRPSASYQDIIVGLGEKGVVPKKFAEENQKMGDFRNKIIHDYDRVDDKLVYAYAVKAPEIFKTFATCFVCFLKENTGGQVR